jgi:quercetin dioxygenase-like cupin family protein
MIGYKVKFDELEWEIPFEGVRHKYLDQDGVRSRLVEYSKKMPPHWCKKGHVGYFISGAMEIQYDWETILYKAGDGIYIPDSPEHRHKATVLSDRALVFFIEKAE